MNCNKQYIISAISAVLMATGASQAMAAIDSYTIETIWHEPDTQPRDTIFLGSFDYDNATKTVSNLKGILSESMTGNSVAYPHDNMTWLTLDYQLVSWYDSSLGGTFAATFKNNNTNTFWTGMGGDGWSPQSGVDAGGVYYGFPRAGNNPGNAYALVFIPDDPLQTLSQTQINYLAYADCAAGGMMGAVCMTGTSAQAYGSVGTMSGYPVSQSISAIAAVPEPSAYAMLGIGLGLIGMAARRRRQG
ncbi:PEP-CTERM sorting domain-containing protein [Methylobacillus sp.]|uniref:PEP-CTERM sorting domain-containing protein n=1 Tax=Methylobacillus sp. TaxID=56818 RepID=UPI002FE2D1ED